MGSEHAGNLTGIDKGLLPFRLLKLKPKKKFRPEWDSNPTGKLITSAKLVQYSTTFKLTRSWSHFELVIFPKDVEYRISSNKRRGVY